MSDKSIIYPSEKVKNASGTTINPATEETIIARSPLTENGASSIGNAVKKFRFG